jgi:queuine tRNA-ribosyltransferase
MAFGTDIVICLDECTHAEASDSDQVLSVNRTLAWASRCKKEFLRLKQQVSKSEAIQPKIFGVIQGGGSFELRKRCAEELLKSDLTVWLWRLAFRQRGKPFI